MLFLPLTPVDSAVSAFFFVVVVLCRHLLSRGCFGFGAREFEVAIRATPDLVGDNNKEHSITWLPYGALADH